MYDDMVPWERDVLISLLVQEVEKENEKRKLEEQAKRARRAARRKR